MPCCSTLRSKELLNDAEPRWQKVACCFIKQKDCLIVHHYEVKQVSWRWQNAAAKLSAKLFGAAKAICQSIIKLLLLTKAERQLVALLSNQRLFGSLVVLAAILPLIQQSCLVADRQQLC